MGLEPAKIVNTDTGEETAVRFNPEEYSVEKANTFGQATVPGLSGPLLQFVSGNMKTLDMELLVDTYEESRGAKAGSDVRELTSKISGLLDINPETHAPPVVLFVWGSLVFRSVLAKVSERFIMFLPSGIPVRARLSVTFNEFINRELEARGVKRETADYTRRYRVGQGQSISHIATEVYHDPGAWRPIALANGLVAVDDLTVGQELVIPLLPYRHPGTGEVVT